MSLSPLALVVAVSQNGVIGRDGDLPWHFPEDLRHFRRITTGHAIIMGRKTWDSIGRPLPRRRNIVVSRQVDLAIDGAEVVSSLEEALELARQDDPEPRIIGGASLYALALPQATVLHLTEVQEEVEGDTHFPPFDRQDWTEVGRRKGEDPRLLFLTLERMASMR